MNAAAIAEFPMSYEPAMGLPRSGHWPIFRHECITAQPWCSACGCEDELELHHIWPVHIRPDLELETTNVIVLCRTDHFAFGHRRWSWKDYDPNCVELVAIIRRHWDKLVDDHRGPVYPKPEKKCHGS